MPALITLTGERQRWAEPGPGASLSALVEARGKNVRAAIQALLPKLDRDACRDVLGISYDSRWRFETASMAKFARPDLSEIRAAWLIVGIWLIGRCAKALPNDASLHEAEEWFFQGMVTPRIASLVSKIDCIEVEQWLAGVDCDDQLAELLPYILDEHGPGSRQSVMKDPATQAARTAKRADGVFYTPSDVADFMVGSLVREKRAVSSCWLDPASGSGVFLRAVGRKIADDSVGQLQFEDVLGSLYGIDESQLAVEMATTVLLYDCLELVERERLAPWRAWHLLRLNFAALDSLRLVKMSGSSCASAKARKDVRAKVVSELRDGSSLVPPAKAPALANGHGQSDLLGETLGIPIEHVFPEVEDGFSFVIGNPPYAEVGSRGDSAWLQTRFESLTSAKDVRAVNMYPLFIELMWQLTKKAHGAAALVVPLSIAFHRGSVFRRCRNAMRRAGGVWRCAFFDREPHALFGEDVKTRNAILFHRAPASADGSHAEFETTSLQKWTSRSRNRLFTNMEFVKLGQFDVTDGIPKLGTALERELFQKIRSSKGSLVTPPAAITSCSTRETWEPTAEHRVFIGGTAYNFLNVYRPHEESLTEDSEKLSDSKVICLSAPTESEAMAAFAILSSNLVFWLWHVTGDGFHVSTGFIQGIPFGRDVLRQAVMEQLSECGKTLWAQLKQHRFMSLNGGKITFGYRPLSLGKVRGQIDEILLALLAADERFGAHLSRFLERTVVVDTTDRKRRVLLNQPNAKESIYECVAPCRG